MKLKHYLYILAATGYAVLAGFVMPWLMSYEHDLGPVFAIGLGILFFVIVPTNLLISKFKTNESSK